MNLETTEEELMHTIFPHPTLSEMMKVAIVMAGKSPAMTRPMIQSERNAL